MTEMGEVEKRLEDFPQALTPSPKGAERQFYLGNRLEHGGKLQAAIKRYNIALYLGHPNPQEVFSVLDKCMERRAIQCTISDTKWSEEAIRFYDEASVFYINGNSQTAEGREDLRKAKEGFLNALAAGLPDKHKLVHIINDVRIKLGEIPQRLKGKLDSSDMPKYGQLVYNG